MFGFCYKSERDAFVNKIKEDGLEITLRDYLEDDTARQLLGLVFSVAFDRLSDEDYEAMVLEVCDGISWEIDDTEDTGLEKDPEKDYNIDIGG